MNLASRYIASKFSSSIEQYRQLKKKKSSSLNKQTVHQSSVPKNVFALCMKILRKITKRKTDKLL